MMVQDVMTTNVVTVPPGADLKSVAELLVRHRISGVPVVADAGGVIGVVSETDLIAKEARDGASRDKQAARTAVEAMTAPPVTVEPHRPLSAAARIMLDRHVNRLPVVRHGELVGIVTRADLVRAFTRPDDAVAGDLREQIGYLLALEDDDGPVEVQVVAGNASLSGTTRRASTATALTWLAERVTGVLSVASTVGWTDDDEHARRRLTRGHSR